MGMIGERIESRESNVTRRGRAEVGSFATVWVRKAPSPLRLMVSSFGSSACSRPPIRCQRFLCPFERGKGNHRCVGLSFRFNPNQLSILNSLCERSVAIEYQCTGHDSVSVEAHARKRPICQQRSTREETPTKRQLQKTHEGTMSKGWNQEYGGQCERKTVLIQEQT